MRGGGSDVDGTTAALKRLLTSDCPGRNLTVLRALVFFLADVGSIGESTLRRWLGAFARAVMTHLKPIYMPGKPFPASEREAVQKQLASRRGLQRGTPWARAARGGASFVTSPAAREKCKPS